MPTRRADEDEKTLEERYTLASDWYRKCKADHEYYTSEYGKEVKNRDGLEKALGKEPDNEIIARELDSANTRVSDAESDMKASAKWEENAKKQMEELKQQHGDAAAAVDKRDQEMAAWRQEVNREPPELKRDSPLADDATKGAAMLLAAHLAVNADAPTLDLAKEMMHQPAAIVQQYNPNDPEQSCEKPAEMTDIAKHQGEDPAKGAHEQLDDNAQDLNEDLQRRTDQETEKKPVVPPTEKSARELADTTAPAPSEDPDHRWTRY
jgi:hypothetical protein